MSVKLTRIYTRKGDRGETSLGDRSRVGKTHPLVEANGEVDELNARVGEALAAPDLPEGCRRPLRRIQNDLFDLGADLSVPVGDDGEHLRIDAGYVEWLEARCDELNDRLPPLDSFLLPGGAPATAALHLCRTACRTAERRVVALDEVNPEVGRYLNRLSDLFFILSRVAAPADSPTWQPGGH